MSCNFCDFKTEGVIYREEYRWMMKLKCGHNRMMGYTLPPDELERRGYINQDFERDPRAVMAEQEEARRILSENFDKIFNLLTGVTHFMDEIGMHHVNPYYKYSIAQVESGKKTKSGREQLVKTFNGILRAIDSKKRAEFNSLYVHREVEKEISIFEGRATSKADS